MRAFHFGPLTLAFSIYSSEASFIGRFPRNYRHPLPGRNRKQKVHPIFDHVGNSPDLYIDMNHEEGKQTPSELSKDKSRRKLLKSASSTLTLLLNTAAASAMETLIEEGSDTETNFLPSSPEQFNTVISVQNSPTPSARVLCADSEEENRISIFQRVAPSVVYIDTFSEKRDVFSANVMEVPIGSGSGFIWDDEGHIVTNFHVVQEAKSAQVAILTQFSGNERNPLISARKGLDLKDATVNPFTSARPGALGISGTSSAVTGFTREIFKAKVVGVDPTKDIAVLKIDAEKANLRPIEVGVSQGLRVGQGSLAIGNPFGLDHTLTTGVISGIGREVKSPTGRPISNVIQTDAAINPGNSGGPLLDSSGRLIGMATAIYSPSGASAGVGFAIPVDTVKYVVERLIQNGQIVRPLLGVSILDSQQARQALGITRGILILEVKPGTPAAKAGLRGLRRSENGIVEIGDIIVAIEGNSIEKEGDLFKAIETFEPGDVVKVTVNRPEVDINDDGTPEIKLKEISFSVRLIASDDTTFLQR
mmetsp:Transcript_4997/g.9923  ORF Transcript_4997/g.9923 Transcript_4997/m.9923 type:complete len:534 (+) Transcript_4997:105-1706(+)